MATAVRDPYVGTVVGGRYDVRSRIASGGMGTVYRALDLRLDREVALKVMHPHLAADATFVARFSREARAAARLSHPGIVAVYDQGADEGAVYLAMEHVPGATLRDVLAARGALRLREALDVAEEILAALSAAHSSGLVHRDVKPENILIGSDGRLRIVDFGLARAASSTGSATSTLIGTVGYLAPELLSTGASDARADVYAVGVVLVELLTGSPPFSGSLPAQVAFRHVHEDVPLPSVMRPDLPAAVDDLVRWSTARVPDQRPADAEELLGAVRRVRAGCSETELEAPVHLVGARVASPTLVAERELALPVPGTGSMTVQVPSASQSPAVAPTVVAPSPLLATAQLGAPGATQAVAGHPARAGARVARPRRRPRSRTRVLVPIVVVLALLAVATAWAVTLGPLGRVSVPPVIGEDTSAARSQLRAVDLGSTEQRAYSDRIDAGRVLSASPPVGSRVRRGRDVTLVVSRGPHLHGVPTLTGRTQASAQRAIAGAGLSVGKVVKAYSESVATGVVISQQTPAGKPLVSHAAVDFTVSQGRKGIMVSSLAGQTQGDATNAIDALGLVVGTVTQQPSATVPSGSVISSSPDTGTLHANDPVDLVVSTGPALVDVPDVVGQDADAATAELEGDGLQVSVNKVFGAPIGQVRQQVPGGGQVPQGTTVALTVF